jgi:hypothetical protein
MLAAPKTTELLDELDRYLATDPEQTDNVLAWWHERRPAFPCLSRMAIDYLSIPGMYQSLHIVAHADYDCSNIR